MKGIFRTTQEIGRISYSRVQVLLEGMGECRFSEQNPTEEGNVEGY